MADANIVPPDASTGSFLGTALKQWKTIHVKTLTVSSTNAVSSDDYTILDDDGYSDIDFTTGAVNRVCTLPTIADNLGRIIWISKVDSGAGKVTVTCEGAETFLDGTTTTFDLNVIGETLALKCSANGWKIF